MFRGADEKRVKRPSRGFKNLVRALKQPGNLPP